MSDTELAQKLEKTRLDELAAGADEDAFDLSAMKKKKKSKKINFDDEDATAAGGEDAAATAAGEEEEDGDDAFADLKKKKKKSKPKVVSFDSDEEAGAEAGNEDAEMFDISAMKKKKKSKKSLAAFEAELGGDEADVESKSADNAGEPWIGTDRDYTYGELLDHFFKIHRGSSHGGADGKKRFVVAPPQIVRDGSKRSIFANVEDIAKQLHRQSDHLIRYLYAELGTTGSIDSSKRLVIKGRFQQKQIENLLRRYIAEYVRCQTCKFGQTSLTKENSLHFVKCEDCLSTRSVAAIKTGFQAVTKDRRRADRAAAGA